MLDPAPRHSCREHSHPPTIGSPRPQRLHRDHRRNGGANRDGLADCCARGDYILALKGNQGALHQAVEQLFDWVIQTQLKDIPHEYHQPLDQGHGRLEIRRHYRLGSGEHWLNAERWRGLRRIGMIASERRIDGQPTTLERRYYRRSLDGDGHRFATAVRSHWGIENPLHGCLDGAFDEDPSRLPSGQAPENMTLMRKIALKLLAKASSVQVGKKAKRLKAGWDNDDLLKVLAA
ncbi:MAG: ISAs1 family transposase [Cyanobacteria bacterium J06636_16]